MALSAVSGAVVAGAATTVVGTAVHLFEKCGPPETVCLPWLSRRCERCCGSRRQPHSQRTQTDAFAEDDASPWIAAVGGVGGGSKNSATATPKRSVPSEGLASAGASVATRLDGEAARAAPWPSPIASAVRDVGPGAAPIGNAERNFDCLSLSSSLPSEDIDAGNIASDAQLGMKRDVSRLETAVKRRPDAFKQQFAIQESLNISGLAAVESTGDMQDGKQVKVELETPERSESKQNTERPPKMHIPINDGSVPNGDAVASRKRKEQRQKNEEVDKWPCARGAQSHAEKPVTVAQTDRNVRDQVIDGSGPRQATTEASCSKMLDQSTDNSFLGDSSKVQPQSKQSFLSGQMSVQEIEDAAQEFAKKRGLKTRDCLDLVRAHASVRDYARCLAAAMAASRVGGLDGGQKAWVTLFRAVDGEDTMDPFLVEEMVRQMVAQGYELGRRARETARSKLNPARFGKLLEELGLVDDM